MDASFYEKLGDTIRRLFPDVDFKPKQATRVHAVNASRHLRPGDLLAVPFHPKHESSLPWHFGISIDEDHVIDIIQGRKPEATIIALADFIGQNYYVDMIPQQYIDEEEERHLTVQRAKYLVQSWVDQPLYNLALFNCKHFALLCCSGRYVSQPSQHFIDILEPYPKFANGYCGKAHNLIARLSS